MVVWPMNEFDSFQKSSREYKDKVTFIVGGQSSTQQALYDANIVDELIGPSLFQIGKMIFELFNQLSRSSRPLKSQIELLPVEVKCQSWKYVGPKGIGTLVALGYTLFFCCCSLLHCTAVLDAATVIPAQLKPQYHFNAVFRIIDHGLCNDFYGL